MSERLTDNQILFQLQFGIMMWNVGRMETANEALRKAQDELMLRVKESQKGE